MQPHPSSSVSLELAVADVSLGIDANAGARVSGLRIGGENVIVSGDSNSHPLQWGSYAMVPFAGRIRNGVLEFEGATHELPIDLEGHSIHGVGYGEPWTLEPSAGLDSAVRKRVAFRLDMATTKKAWPFGGIARQEVELGPDSLTLTLEVTAGSRAMPLSMGWHPWWVRQLGKGGSLEFDVDFSGARRYEKFSDGTPTGTLLKPGTGPWDDCFIGIREVTLRWPGFLEIEIAHDCSHVTIYDEPEHALCVEPQSGPPGAHQWDADASRLAPGETMRRSTTWSWTLLG